MADKFRYWDFITYEPYDKVKSLLDEEGGDYLISPLHQPDDDKKPHYHVMYCHGAPTTAKHVRKVIPDVLPANGVIEAVLHPANRQRYYLHLDDPEKQQFPDGYRELTIIKNFPLDLTRPLSAEEKKLLPKRILEFIREFNIIEYNELVDGLSNYDDELFLYAVTHTIFLARYLDSKRFGGQKKG